jgi:hypothetical protein
MVACAAVRGSLCSRFVRGRVQLYRALRCLAYAAAGGSYSRLVVAYSMSGVGYSYCHGWLHREAYHMWCAEGQLHASYLLGACGSVVISYVRAWVC